MITVDLSKKRALVCGSSQGIGRAIAQEFARCGASVCLVARNLPALEQVKNSLPADQGQVHHAITADFSAPETLREEVARYIERTGPVAILVNNTGGPPPGPLLEASSSALTAAFSSHLLCNHYLTQAVTPGMKAAGTGRIINIVSTSVREPLPGLGVSNTTRGAVASWAKTLSAELGPYGITINNILPGPTETGRLTAILEKKAKEHGISIEKESADLVSKIPLRRLGKPEEIAYAACFLASDAASFITGVSLAVDGGRIASI